MTPEFIVADESGGGPGIEQCPDVYFTAGYGAAAAIMDDGSWHSVYSPGRFMIPYVVRRLGTGDRDAASPHGYSGIHISSGCSSGQLARFWSRTLDHWRASGLVSVFLRFSPQDPASVTRARALPGVRLVRSTYTFTVAVGAGSTQVWSGMQGRSRTAIRKARSAGMDAIIRPAAEADLVRNSAFRILYEQTMRRVGSVSSYLFPDTYYRKLARGLGKNLLITEVHDRGGDVVATALVLRHRDRVHYHLAGSRPAAARDGANNLLVWTILQWAAESGCTLAHLGGGVRPDDGLFQFKRSFGGRLSTFWTGGVIVDPARYDALLLGRAGEIGTTVEEIRESDFFPGYRKGTI